jgi:ComF family protein
VLALCPDCQKARGGRPWRLAATAFPYFGGARTAVRLFKYHGRLSLAPYLGRRMAAAWLEQGGDVSVDVVSYVPLFFTRYLQRGYNQAAVLADFVGRELGLPVLRTLLRRRRTPRQAGLNRAGRLRNLRGAFLPWRANRWAGRSVLLVDDVFTTGSTLHEAATTLLAGGAAEISVLTAARD